MLRNLVWKQQRQLSHRLLVQEQRCLAHPPTMMTTMTTSVRGMAAAATTSAEKRALNKQQLRGSPSAAAAQGGAAPPPPPPPAGGSSGSNLPFVLGGVALVGAGVAYSQGLIPGIESHPDEIAEEQATDSNSSSSSNNNNNKKDTTVAADAADAVSDEKSSQKGEVGEEEKKEEDASSSSANTKATEAKAAGGNRVLSISLPKGSKRSAPPPVIEDHPTGGNKVSMMPTSSSSSSSSSQSLESVTNTTPSVDTALEELQAQLSKESSVALKEAHQELAKLLNQTQKLEELDQLSSTQLKIRLVQLSKDLEDRTKWEAVRLKEFLAMKEKEVEDKYLLLMKKQRMEAETNMDRSLKEKEYTLTSQTQQAMQEKEQALQGIIDHSLKIQEQQFMEEKVVFEKKAEEAISAKYEELFGKSLADVKENFRQKMEQKVAQIEALSKTVSELEFSLKDTKSYQAGSLQAHRMSAAALSLFDQLESSKPAGSAIAALQSIATDNAVIQSALEGLPDTAKKSGIATLQELQTKFDTVHSKCRQAALVPAGQSGLEGQLMGMVFSTLKFAPGPEDAAPENEKDAAEFVLARAQKHVHLGELEQAVTQMDKLTGQAQFVAQNWTQQAKERVAVEKALKVIRLECALANESMSQVPANE